MALRKHEIPKMALSKLKFWDFSQFFALFFIYIKLNIKSVRYVIELIGGYPEMSKSFDLT